VQENRPFPQAALYRLYRGLTGQLRSTLIVFPHRHPDNATEEINGLDEVLSYAQSQNPDENDFVIGDDVD
jgi:hypothetical protein